MSPRRAFPERAAGGFARRDGTVEFYTRVRSLVDPEYTVLDLGAGRAAWTEDQVDFRRELRSLKGEVKEVIAADIDPIVKENPSCDRAILMPDSISIPLNDSSVDIVICDHTFEHIEKPAEFAEEVRRVLRRGGWLCARTPNRWGYIGLATNLVPNSAHRQVLRMVQPHRKAEDVFPTTYPLNTRKAVSAHFPAQYWECYMYTTNPEPAYFGTSDRLVRTVDSVTSKFPGAFGATWSIFLRHVEQ